MSKTNRSRSSRSSKTAPARNEPWIKPGTGLWIIGIASLVFAVFVGWQVYPSLGFWKSVLWGTGAAAALWLVYGLSFLVNSTFRR